jgi:F-type H+-transporting ATPase subunit a
LPVAKEGKTIDALSQFELTPFLGGFGQAIGFSQSNAFMLLALGLITLFIMAAAARGAMIPGRLQSLGEASYEFIQGMVTEQVGDEGKKYFPFVFAVFMFVLFGNLLGMLPYAFTFTSHIAVTLTLAPIIIPVEVISYFSRVVSLSVRLFANMVAGHVMLKVFATFVVLLGSLGAVGPFVAVLPLSVNIALVGFEFLVAFLQAYVFAILTSIYLHDAVHLH